MKTIKLQNGKCVTLGEYVRSWKKLKSIPKSSKVTGFSHFSETAEYILTKINFGVQDRINRHIPDFGKGRKWSSDWQREAGNTARNVNTPRLIVRRIPAHFMPRLAHRLSE